MIEQNQITYMYYMSRG